MFNDMKTLKRHRRIQSKIRVQETEQEGPSARGLPMFLRFTCSHCTAGLLLSFFE